MMGYQRMSQLLGSVRTASGCTLAERTGPPEFGICGMLAAGFFKTIKIVLLKEVWNFVLCESTNFCRIGFWNILHVSIGEVYGCHLCLVPVAQWVSVFGC